MNVFLFEFKAATRASFGWILAFAAIVVFFMSFYASFHSDAVQVSQLLSGIPETVRKALSLDISSLTTMFGFFSYILPYVLLGGAVQALALGMGMVAKETNQKTVDFLLAKPISRAPVLTAKLLAGLAWIILTNIAFLIVTLIMAKVVNPDPFSQKTLLLLSVSLGLVQLFFLAFGGLVACVKPKIKSVIGVSLSTAFVFFILNLFGSIIGDSAIRYVTPFKFYDPRYIVAHSVYEARFMLLELAYVVIFLVVGYAVYSRRDNNQN